MPTAILATKLYAPPPRPKLVQRPHLIERLNEGLHRKLTLISAPAGFGKTTLVSEWIAGCGRPVAWLSLDKGDSDPSHFLSYLVAALQTIAADLGESVLGALQSPQPPSTEAILTALLNQIVTFPQNFVLVLDDYHVIDAKAVDHALAFLLEHMPPQMHLVITTREDPDLPIARLRARGQLTELRITDLRFTHTEAASFLNQVMGLNLSTADIAALENRTEGWIAGLQLAALSMHGHQDTTSFIQSFTGSHHFVLDYLVEEVLQQQPEPIQNFLLRTSILDRLCGSLCDAVLLDHEDSGQEMLETLERANLFIMPLDNERRWYRYHHLFADLLRQRLQQRTASLTAPELHIRASAWYEANGLEVEAFHHAVTAHDVERAARLIEGEGMPLYYRGAVVPIVNWLRTLSPAVLDAKPSMWVMYAAALSIAGQNAAIEPVLKAAEAAIQDAEPSEQTNDLIGQIASQRAMLAAIQYDVDTLIDQSQRALRYLALHNLPVRTVATWTLGYAYQLQGDRLAAIHAFQEAIAISKQSGNVFTQSLAATGLGNMQEAENELHAAAETYQSILTLVGEPEPPTLCEAHLGLGRIFYEWNDLDAAEAQGQQSARLARQIEHIDSPAACEVFLARVKLARGDIAGASVALSQAERIAQQNGFAKQLPEITSVRVLILLRQGDVESAAALTQAHDLPLSQARVCLAQNDTASALAGIARWRQQAEAKDWKDERLKAMVLQAIAYTAQSNKNQAMQVLGEALTLAQPSGFIRVFINEGAPMAQLLSEANAQGMMPEYTMKLLDAFSPLPQDISPIFTQPLIEPLSKRELEVLQLIAQGLSNHEIGEKLFLALSSVKGHNQNIFEKLQVQRRTEAVVRARELGLL